MRKGLVIIVLLCGAWQGGLLHGDEPAPPAEVEEEAVAVVETAPPGPLERLGQLVGEESGAPPPPPRMVHCVIEEEGAFLRESECRERGGVIDEPSWARSED